MPPEHQVMYRGEIGTVKKQCPENDTTMDLDIINVDPDPLPQATEMTSQV